MYTNQEQEIAYLLSLQAVRDRSRLVLQAAEEGALNSFDYDAKRMPEVADFVLGVISVSLLLEADTRLCRARLPTPRWWRGGPKRTRTYPPHGC